MGQCPDGCLLLHSCGDAPELLYRLLDEACRVYRKEVIGRGKLYRRFTADFLNGHRHTDAVCAAGKNAHETATGTMADLFNNRPDLVKAYFSKPGLTRADAEEMITELDTGRPDRTGEADGGRPGFMASLSDSQKAALAALASRFKIFRGTISADDISSLLDCRAGKPLKAANNRRVAVLFDELAAARLIERDWQKVIAANGLIISSATDAPLGRSSISSALAEARAEKTAAITAIRKGVRQVADMKENEHTAMF